jgi:two-component system response regulator DesR
MIKVMIVADHPVVRNGLEAMLSVEEDMEVVAAVEGGDAAVAWCAKNVRNLPDVVVADVHMPKGDGFGMLAAMRNSHPGVRVLLLAGMPLKDEETRAREDGARGIFRRASTDASSSSSYGGSRRLPPASRRTPTSRTPACCPTRS